MVGASLGIFWLRSELNRVVVLCSSECTSFGSTVVGSRLSVVVLLRGIGYAWSPGLRVGRAPGSEVRSRRERGELLFEVRSRVDLGKAEVRFCPIALQSLVGKAGVRFQQDFSLSCFARSPLGVRSMHGGLIVLVRSPISVSVLFCAFGRVRSFGPRWVIGCLQAFRPR